MLFISLQVRQDDVVSTMICQDCHDHLDDFNKFCHHVAEKQCTLRNEFFEVQLKEEENHDDNSQDAKPSCSANKIVTDDADIKILTTETKEMEQAMFEFPIDILKRESNDEEEKEEEEVIAADVFDDNDLNTEEDVLAESADIDPVDILSSEGNAIKA